ncbi:MAG: hypothetical protein NT062_20330 [Proteobacteria bacterium]|nr:hypothetical protein [Pseudomonadota bacterium]
MRASCWLLLGGLALVATACSSSHSPTIDRLDCVSCHASEYDDMDPNMRTTHAAQGFARTCYTCHGTGAWKPAAPVSGAASRHPFDLTSSSHAGWDCADCHTSGVTADPDPQFVDPKQISCIDCHAHTAGRTDPYHVGNGDYRYEPRACLQCHGRGGRN